MIEKHSLRDILILFYSVPTCDYQNMSKSLDQNCGPFWTLWDHGGVLSHPSHPHWLRACRPQFWTCFAKNSPLSPKKCTKKSTFSQKACKKVHFLSKKPQILFACRLYIKYQEAKPSHIVVSCLTFQAGNLG